MLQPELYQNQIILSMRPASLGTVIGFLSNCGLSSNFCLSSTRPVFHGTAPQYMSELLPLYNLTSTLRSSSQSRLSVPGYRDDTCKRRYGARSFKFAAPVLWNNFFCVCVSNITLVWTDFKKKDWIELWNNLPPALKNTQSLTCFKTQLKTSFYSVLARSSFSFDPVRLTGLIISLR